MFLVFAVAAGVFFSMGLGVPTSKTQDGVCQDPKTVLRAGSRILIVSRPTENCSCTLEDGQPGTYPDGAPCFNGSRRIGNCSKGVCNVTESVYGCAGKNGTEEGSTIDPVLCVFECKSAKGVKEWGYLPDGFPCVNKDDGTNETGKNGTCKHRPHRDRENETVCFPNDQLHLVGC
uniref:Putative secreted protein n=1 Tax=Amblyomma cajennense TaxID=34607 RepID=A0A023FTH4_AMBCJ